MLSVCVCDDEVSEADYVRMLAHDFAKKHPEFPLQVEEFLSPAELLQRLERKGGFDIYLLDVIMPGMSGVELAAYIRQRGEPAELLFLTSSKEYALDAFGVSASGYLLKPVAKSQFDEALLAAVNRLTQPANPSFWLKTKDGMKKILLRDLVAVESFNHDRVCYLSDGTSFTTADTLSSLMKRLQEDKRFFSPHRAYIINLEHITSLDATWVTLTGGRRIPVSRTSVMPLREAYMRYLF